MTTARVYIFNGSKLKEYSNYKTFKEKIADSGLDIEATTIKEIFEYIFANHRSRKREFDKLYFEHVFYGQLKNVYFQKITNVKPRLATFMPRVRAVINNMNKKESIPLQYHDLFSDEAFYLLDTLDLENRGNVFLLGHDHTITAGKVSCARFLIAQVVIRDGEPEYFLAGLEINYEERFYLLMLRNVTGIDPVPTSDGLLEEEKWDKTMNKFITKINQLILRPLQIFEDFDYEKDRQGMYRMCKELDEGLLSEYRELIDTRLGGNIDNSIEEWSEEFFEDEGTLNVEQKSTLKNKISSQLLALYLKNNTQINLVERARNLGLVGYTTRIEFKANRAGKGATKSRSGSSPIATEDMFHSLYIDFKGALQLPKWSLSWFTDEDDDDYIQTTVHITKNYFKIVFLPDRQLDKETIYRVIRHINRYRDYEIL